MDTPPPLPDAEKSRSSRKTLWIILACVGGLVVLSAPIMLAILIPTVAKVRETAQRTVAGSNLRQIGQSALIYAFAHDDQCPPVHLAPDGTIGGSTPATIHAVAAALSRDGGMNEASLWMAAVDRDMTNPVLSADRKTLDPAFARHQTFAWDFATGLTTSMPTMTPIAWTRGLREDGTWDKAGVYGDHGGFVAFLGGNMAFFRNLKANPLTRPDGMPTSNILAVLPTSARVVGAGPGTLHGSRGLAAP